MPKFAYCTHEQQHLSMVSEAPFICDTKVWRNPSVPGLGFAFCNQPVIPLADQKVAEAAYRMGGWTAVRAMIPPWVNG